MTSGSEARFAAYVEDLSTALGHADRTGPLRDYCLGLLMPVERKSVEPMAAVTAPARVAAQHQSLLHFVGQGGWSDDRVLAKVRDLVSPAMERNGAIEAWIIDDTGFPKKGKPSVGVARQYCGQFGKQDNCQVAVSLSIANHAASLPIAYKLYMPEDWSADPIRRSKAGIPDDLVFRTKPEIALDQIRAAFEAGIPRGVMLMDAGYGADTRLRADITAFSLTPMWQPSSRTRRSASRARDRSRRSPGRGGVDRRAGCAAMPSITLHSPVAVGKGFLPPRPPNRAGGFSRTRLSSWRFPHRRLHAARQAVSRANSPAVAESVLGQRRWSSAQRPKPGRFAEGSAMCMLKVAEPPAQNRVEVGDDARQASALLAFRHRPNPVLEPVEALLGDHAVTALEPIAEEVEAAAGLAAVPQDFVARTHPVAPRTAPA